MNMHYIGMNTHTVFMESIIVSMPCFPAARGGVANCTGLERDSGGLSCQYEVTNDTDAEIT